LFATTTILNRFATPLDFGSSGNNIVPTVFSIHRENMAMTVFIEQKLATFKTHALIYLHYIFDVLNEENGASHLNMPKITRRIDIRKTICGADNSWFQYTHPRVK
jgi:hypothetical protein